MDVNSEILNEVRLFANSVVLGAGLTFMYDGWLICRKAFKHSNFMVSLEDLSFWFFTTIVIFLALREQNDGILRWFLVVGAGIGMLLYKNSVSRFYVNYCGKAIQYIVVYIKRLAYFVLTPFKIVKNRANTGFSKVNNGIKKVTITLKKRLTVCIKWFTIALCKHNGENGDLHNEEEV